MITDPIIWLINNACPAVVPSLLGPLHALVLLLPQILLGLVLVASSLTNPSAWRDAAFRVWTAMRTKPLKSSGWLLLMLASPWLLWWAFTPVQTPTEGSGVLVVGGNWLSFHGGPNRCGTVGLVDAHVKFTPQLRWKFRDSLILERRPFACSPAVVGSRKDDGFADIFLLIGSDNYKLYCVSLDTGQLQWSFEAGYPIFSSPAVWNERVYIGEGLHYDANTNLYCLNLRNGEVIWSFQTNSHTESSPTVDNGRVYFGAGDDGLYCLDAITGEVQWRFPDAHVDGGPLVAGDHVYLGSGYVYNGLICVSAQDGQPVWKRAFRAPVWGAPSFSAGRLYIGIGNGNFNESDPNPFGEVRCLSPTDGQDIWRFADVKDSVLTSVALSNPASPSFVKSPLIPLSQRGKGLAVFGSRDGACYALNSKTGKLVWRTEVGVPILSSPAIAGRYVFFGADDGLFRCLNLEDGKEVWAFDTTDDVLIVMEDARIQSSPAIASGMVIFGSSNGNVYCLGGDEKTTAVVSQAGYRSRLMRAADFLLVGLVKQLARFTRSYGLAIILVALIVKLLLLPLDWKQTRQGRKLKELQPEIDRIKSEASDHRAYLSALRELYTAKGVYPLSALVVFLVQVPLFIVVFLILQSTPVFTGKSFFWIADLSIPDRLAPIPSLPWLGSRLNLLPLVLVVSVWLYLTTFVGSRSRLGILGQIFWLLLALGIGVLTYRWSSALLLFTIALLWFGIFIQRVFLVLDSSSM